MKPKLQDPWFTDCFQNLCNSLTWFYKIGKSKFFWSEWFRILPFSLQLALAYLWFCWQCGGYRYFNNPAQGKLIWNTDHKHTLKLNPILSHQGVDEKLVHETCQFKEYLRFVLAQGWASLMSQTVKNLPAVQETQACSLGWEDPLEEGWLQAPESCGQRSLAGNSRESWMWLRDWHLHRATLRSHRSSTKDIWWKSFQNWQLWNGYFPKLQIVVFFFF